MSIKIEFLPIGSMPKKGDFNLVEEAGADKDLLKFLSVFLTPESALSLKKHISDIDLNALDFSKKGEGRLTLKFMLSQALDDVFNKKERREFFPDLFAIYLKMFN